MALRYLRLEDKARVLWTDAICVNQQDLEERGSQVERMADIHKDASQVVVWLGPGAGNSSLAMRTLHSLGLQIDVNWRTYTMRPSSQGDPHWADSAVELPHDDETGDAIHRLLDRSWFKRLWIWQEVRLARRVEVLCGCERISWKRFRDGIFCLWRKPDCGIGGVQRVFDIANSHGSTTLLHILCLTMHSECSDQRDRIYGLLNLIPSCERVSSLKPDYSQSPQQVFQDVVLRYATQRGEIKLLSCCERLGDLVEKPTWVPDWSTPRECTMLYNGKASWLSKAEVEYASDRTLKVTGLCSAEVDSVEGISLDVLERSYSKGTRKLARIFQSLTKRMDVSGLYAGGGDMLGAICCSFCADHVAERYMPNGTSLPELEKFKEFMMDILRNASGSTQLYRPYLEQVAVAMTGRSFFTTREGYVGLAPKAVKRGDQICILLDCNSPMLLRSDEAGNLIVVGECYIHGLMDGEALLGLLPGHWQRVAIIHDPKIEGRYDGFINRDTGETCIEDPRLGPLPPGWRVAAHTDMRSWDRYVNDDTGEGHDGVDFDPRMTADALRERGVKLTQFTLI